MSENTVPANPSTSISRLHVESEESLNSVIDFPGEPMNIDGFIAGEGMTQWLSGDRDSGESTQRVTINKGWKAPIGHFTEDVEIFVLSGHIKQGGFDLREHSYTYIPAGTATGPWEASDNTVVLWMPDCQPKYDADTYKDLAQISENSAFHKNTQHHDRIGEFVPLKELKSMAWESTTFLPPGSARKSLYTNPRTGRSTWILGLVPEWIEGNFLAGHPTTEEAYLITGDVKGHWSMADAPFERRYAEMNKDGYYWRPAHIPHGPFWTEKGALCLFRTKDKLDCHWQLHNTDIAQLNYSK